MGYNDEDEEESGISFARRFRPYSLEGYIGNAEIKETIKSYLKNQKRPQTILVTGSSGCGKTTIGRIIEREYRCENRDPETGACGVCPSCQMFNEYIRTGVQDDLSDVYEIDASSKSGKKDINSMLETMEYPAMAGDWKVYMIDEAHLLRDEAMGRLLKSLEEPPEGVLIILCTTNPEMLLDTVRNRCQLKFAVKKPTTIELMNHLKHICTQEGKEYDQEGLRMICGRVDNTVRDALNDLETVLATKGTAKAIDVSAQFNQVTDRLIFDFYKAYFNNDYVAYTDVLYKIKTEYSFDLFLVSLTTFTIRGIYILNSIQVDGLTTEEIKQTLDLFSKFSIKELSILLSELRKMSYGNIEANLLAFIYCKDRGTTENEDSNPVNMEGNISIEEEHKFRNDNLQRLEKARLAKGAESVTAETAEVSIADMKNLFNLEKVT